MLYIRTLIVGAVVFLLIPSISDACPPKHRYRNIVDPQPMPSPTEPSVNDCDAVLKSHFVQLLRLPKQQYDKVDPLILKHEWDSISVKFNKCMQEKYGDVTIKFLFYSSEGQPNQNAGPVISKLFINVQKNSDFDSIKKQLPALLGIRNELIGGRPFNIVQSVTRNIGKLKTEYKNGDDINYSLFHQQTEDAMRNDKRLSGLFAKAGGTNSVDSKDSVHWSKGLRVSSAYNKLNAGDADQVLGKKSYYWKLQIRLEKTNEKECSMSIDILVASRLASQSENTMQWISYRKGSNDVDSLTFDPKVSKSYYVAVDRIAEEGQPDVNGSYAASPPVKSTSKASVFHEIESTFTDTLLKQFFNP